MIQSLHLEIATFAARHGIPVEHAHTLPGIFDWAAKHSGHSVRVIVSHATYSNQPLADYIKESAAKVAKELAKEVN